MNATITWYEDRHTGLGMLLLQRDDGTEEQLAYDGEPIHTGNVDSHQLASLFGNWAWVEQDGEYIHCGMTNKVRPWWAKGNCQDSSPSDADRGL